MYSSFAQRLFESKDVQISSDETSTLTDKLRNKLPSLDEFKVAFKGIVFTNSNSKQRNLVRYILRKIAEYYSYKYPVDFDDLTIEHLHPQSEISNDWKEEIVGCLGNFILLDQKMDGEIANKSFKDKKSILLNEGYTLPEIIYKAEDWTPYEAIKNTEYLAEIAYTKIWEI